MDQKLEIICQFSNASYQMPVFFFRLPMFYNETFAFCSHVIILLLKLLTTLSVTKKKLTNISEIKTTLCH